MKGSVYERQTDRILTGGWNVLTPGDLISPSEALQCENFRIDTAGNLRSRLGHGNVIYNTGAVQQFCQVKGSSTRRYSATYLGSLWRNNTVLGSFGFGSKIGMVSYKGLLWAMSQSTQKRDDGVALSAWSIAGPVTLTYDNTGNPSTVKATAGGGGFGLVLGKVYTYWTTYVDASGLESVSSPAGCDTAPVAVPNQIMTIYSPAASTGAVGWNLYRSGNTLQDTLRINRSTIAIGANFVDNGDPASQLDDLSVTRLGISLDADASGPPAGNGLAGPYYEHLLAWGVAAHPNRLYWSKTLQPQNWPGANLDDGNHVDLGELGEAIVGVTFRPRVATIYKDSSIWRLIGDPDSLEGDLEPVTTAIGAMSPPISVGTMDYFEGKEGLYSYNGERPVKITGKLDPLFRGETPEAAGFAFSPVAPLEQDPSFRSFNRLGHRNGRLYFFYCATGNQLPNRGMVTELGADNWGSDGRAVTAMLDEGQNGLMLASISTLGVGTAVYSMEEGETDAGVNITCSYHSGYKDQGAPEQVKTYADVVIEHNTGNAPVVVFAFYDNGTKSEALGTVQSTAKTITTLQLNTAVTGGFTGLRLGWQARNLAIRLEGTNSAGPIFVYKILAHYFVEPHESRTFDSDETDLGTQKVKAVSEIELDIDYPAVGGGTIIWELFAGLASGACSLRDSSTIAATVGRQILRIPVAAGIEGRLVRVALRCDTAGSTFRIYGCRLRCLVIGEHHDGARAEYFTTQEIR